MIITFYVQPNAKLSEIVQWIDEDTIKIKIAAPPINGKANKELLRVLSKTLKIPKTSIEIIRGAQTKIKQVKIPLKLEEIKEKITSL